jgi:hypothetical protein
MSVEKARRDEVITFRRAAGAPATTESPTS